ncbi:MAG: Type 1 glutamine amidotransferase-like domain-containing protein, partial [Candidatus Moraniibacteriota bacterium]
MKNNIFLTSDGATVIHDIVKHFDFENKKKVLFVETSGETHDGEKPWIDNAKKKMKQLGFNLINYTITGKIESEIEEALRAVDILYVAGGDSSYLLYQSQKNNFAKVVKKFIENGGIYIGQSAGSIVAGPNISPLYKPERNKWFEKLNNFDGYGLVDFITVPHFGREDKKKDFFDYKFKNLYSKKYKIIFLTDRQYIR